MHRSVVIDWHEVAAFSDVLVASLQIVAFANHLDSFLGSGKVRFASEYSR